MTLIQVFFPILLLTFLFTDLSFAQTETLAGRTRGGGGFGGPFMEVGRITGNVGTSVGGGGAGIFGDVFFGGFGFGASYGDAIVGGRRNRVTMGAGGFWMGYTPQIRKLVHPYTSLKIGWGGVHVQPPNATSGDEKYSDRITLLQPELGMEVNITRWFRLAISGGYRFISGVNSLPGGLSNNDFRSLTGNLTFRFGGFPG